MTTYIYGSSDDLVEFEGDFHEEYNTYDHGYFHVQAPDSTGVRVEAHYGENGTWLIGAAPLDGGEPMPWSVRYVSPGDGAVRYANHYTSVLAIETPEDVVVTRVNKRGELWDDE